MKTDCPVLYIVVPCFNEQEALPQSHSRLAKLLDEMISQDSIAQASKLLYVDDGSRDDTWAIIEKLAAESDKVVGLKLACNSGHQNALMAGLSAAVSHCDITVSIDADLQDDINVIPQMVERYKNGCDIVFGVRKERKTDTWFKRTTANMFYGLMRRLGVSTIENHADYRLMSSRAVLALLDYKERNLFIRGIVTKLGYKTDCVYYDRSARIAGESKYPFKKMVNFAIDGITSFSVKPVRLVFAVGVVFLLIALIMLIYVLCAYFMGRAVSGWPSIILSIWFVGAFVLIGLGIIGEYVGKIYTEVKNRPRYNVDTTVGFDKTEGDA
ncbi:MAG: glycosyltransferase family 2 protein [Muribaculaceae bacterium]|nr:glycosyltransferase family 2 protein [Muribaculaceae bacterium]